MALNPLNSSMCHVPRQTELLCDCVKSVTPSCLTGSKQLVARQAETANVTVKATECRPRVFNSGARARQVCNIMSCLIRRLRLNTLFCMYTSVLANVLSRIYCCRARLLSTASQGSWSRDWRWELATTSTVYRHMNIWNFPPTLSTENKFQRM